MSNVAAHLLSLMQVKLQAIFVTDATCYLQRDILAIVAKHASCVMSAAGVGTATVHIQQVNSVVLSVTYTSKFRVLT